VNTRRMRTPAITGFVAILALALAACTAATPTDIIIHTTPTPGPTATPTLNATPSPTSTAAATDTSGGGGGGPTPSASPTPSGSATATATATATGPAATAAPGDMCSGSATTKAWWTTAANQVGPAIYCGIVSGSWYFQGAGDTWGSKGTVVALYQTNGGAKIVLQEGAFCLTSAAACSPHDSTIGAAKFGDLDGTLYTCGTSHGCLSNPSYPIGAGAGLTIYVNPGQVAAYTATGRGVDQATFKAIVAALVRVAKS